MIDVIIKKIKVTSKRSGVTSASCRSKDVDTAKLSPDTFILRGEGGWSPVSDITGEKEKGKGRKRRESDIEIRLDNVQLSSASRGLDEILISAGYSASPGFVNFYVVDNIRRIG